MTLFEALLDEIWKWTAGKADLGKVEFSSLKRPSSPNYLFFPLMIVPIKLAFSSMDWEFCDGSEALFRRRHLEVAA